MAVDMFLKVSGIPGECQKKGHTGEIDIESFSFGASQTGSFHHGGAGGGAGKAEIQDVTVVKYADKASVKLFNACASGEHLPEVVIYAQKAGDNKAPLTYYTIKMQDVIVANVSNQGSSAGDRITETVTFNTAKLTFDYQPQKADGGKDGGVITAFYDVRQNVAG